MEHRAFGGAVKRSYDFSESYRAYKTMKTDFEIKEKSYEDLKNVFLKQHRKLGTRKQKYHSKMTAIENYRKRRSERKKKGKDSKTTALEKSARKAELKYRMALNSAETKFSLLETAYVMYEKSLLEFQAERMRLMQLTLKLDQK